MRKIIRKTGILAFVLALCLSFSAAAEEVPAFHLQTETDGVSVQLSGLPDTKTMKVSFEIKTEKGSCRQAAFRFEESIASEVQEYRYREDTQILTLYLSGKDVLSKDGSLTLGKITLDADENTKVQISTVTDSFSYVDGNGREVSTALKKAELAWSNETTIEETTPPKETTPEESTPEESTPEETTLEPEETTTGKMEETTVSRKDSDKKSDLKGNAEKASGRTGTGDTQNITGYVIGVIAAALVLVIGFCWKKKNK